jgi:hypothetical protein
MRNPKSVRIAGREWKFRYRGEKAMPDACGLTHHNRGLIDIRTRLEEFDRRDTVVHEIFHGILYQQGHENDTVEEEKYVRALASGFVGVMRDNPELVKWLMEDFNNANR